MRKWPRKTTLVIAACVMILVGIAPPAYIVWSDWQLMQLSIPISFHRGLYTSPEFNPKHIAGGMFRDAASTTQGEYRLQVSLFHETQQTSYDAGYQWAVLDARGASIAGGSGTRLSVTGPGTTILLGDFTATKGSPLFVRLSLNRELPDLDAARPRLQVVELRNEKGLPLVGALAVFWAMALGGSGIVLLFVLVVRAFGKRSADST